MQYPYARLGQLYLQDGVSGEQQVLPRGRAISATTPKFTWRSVFGPLQQLTHGHLWWLEERQRDAAFMAWGYSGQLIYVVPGSQMVVIATTDWRGLSAEGGPNPLEQAVLDVIINGVLPSLN